MAGRTLSEKILARASGRKSVAPGDVVVCRVDRAMTYEPFAGELHARFRARWGARARVWDAERLVLVADHFLDTSQPDHARMHEALDAFARAMGVRHYYPLGAANHGICHALLPEEGLMGPGELIAGTDSHSCTYGGWGGIGLGIGLDAMEGILAVGQTWVEVPPMVRIQIDGRFPPDVYAKDVILHLCGTLGNRRGLLGTAVELDGEAVQALHPEEKLTLANMAVEAGARWITIPPDDTVLDWVRALGRTDGEPLWPDADARYQAVHRLNGTDFAPTIALPHAPDRTVRLEALPRTRFNEVFVGSCTGAKRFDLERLVEGLGADGANPGPAPGVTLQVVPATRRVREWMFATPERAAMFSHPRVQVAPQPGCNACFGGYGFLTTPGSVRLSTTNRNFRGRMGVPEAEVYLASPALAARAALTGELGG